MARLVESVLVGASLKEAWDLYFEPRAWRAWVDGFDAVESSTGYPDAGGTLVWRSTPAGRGTVRERVVEHSPRTLHRIAFEDPQSSGELETRFAVEGEGTRITVALEYALTRRTPFSALTDRLFVRGQVRGSLRRTLARFRREVEDGR
jgi:Polyketide cyclase / dehydrase and lipid transport